MLWQLQLSLLLCTQQLFTCTCLCFLLLHWASSSCLSAFSPHIRSSSHNPSQLYSLSHSGSPSPLVLPFSILRSFITNLLVYNCCSPLLLPSHYPSTPLFTPLKPKIQVKSFLCTVLIIILY